MQKIPPSLKLRLSYDNCCVSNEIPFSLNAPDISRKLDWKPGTAREFQAPISISDSPLLVYSYLADIIFNFLSFPLVKNELIFSPAALVGPENRFSPNRMRDAFAAHKQVPLHESIIT